RRRDALRSHRHRQGRRRQRGGAPGRSPPPGGPALGGDLFRVRPRDARRTGRGRRGQRERDPGPRGAGGRSLVSPRKDPPPRGYPDLSRSEARHSRRPLHERGRVAVRLYAIAINTFREAIRDRILYLILAFALIMIGASRAISLLTVGSEEKIVKDMGL